MGLHTRPATTIVQLLQGVGCEVTFTHQRETINAKSLLSILMLAATKNARITITIDGDEVEARKTMDDLIDAFATGFGEGVP